MVDEVRTKCPVSSEFHVAFSKTNATHRIKIDQLMPTLHLLNNPARSFHTKRKTVRSIEMKRQQKTVSKLF